jgi:hypothetical protein
MHFFLDLFLKISEKSRHRNRGGFYSAMNVTPAAFEITGTLTVSANAESLGASIAVRSVIRGGISVPASLNEENRYRDTKG